ncbi:MAG: A/G-specific adenine glycosylase [Dysgonamonadaceae bacterium]|jgi:A/G-specific adenine glycosylase|nr:A/G-specific adenine glycosylase [Dysgonamonadaceae bacterium]
MENYKFVGEKILSWYQIHKRILPWRDIANPYKIWISEIILQQTRVVQGLEYYERFIERFPDVHTLAAADEQEVLKYWQGLGYYSRARNLFAAARHIETHFGGKFPEDYAALLNLKGVGEYTAAAIASFAFNLPYPVVDGNVFRFLSRLFAVREPIDSSKGKKFFTDLAGRLMDRRQAGLFNQAIMEFGALQCVPASPDCGGCIFTSQCLAKMQGKVSEFPVKSSKPETKTVFLYYFMVRSGDFIFLKKREGKGIWQNLYEFPSVESETPLSFEDLVEHSAFRAFFPANTRRRLLFKPLIKNYKHVLTHRTLYADCYEVSVAKASGLGKCKKIRRDEIEEYPVHRLMQRFWEMING